MIEDKTREELIAMSDEEIMCWVYDIPVGSTVFAPPIDSQKLKEFQYRWDRRFGVSLTRLGIQLQPTTSRELTINLENVC